MGGKEAVEKLVNVFYGIVLSHPDLKSFFAHAKMDRQIQLQTIFVTNLINGGTGLGEKMRETMVKAHEKLGLTDFHVDKIEECFKEAILQFDYPETTVGRFVQCIEQARPMVLGYSTRFKHVHGQDGNEKLVIIVDEKQPTHTGPEMYRALGGRYALGLISKKAYQFMAHDKELKGFFENHSLDRIAKAVQHYLSDYFQDTIDNDMRVNMQRAHLKINLTGHHFDLFKSYFEKSCIEFELTEQFREKVLNAIEFVRFEIVPKTMNSKSSFISSNGSSEETELFQRVGGDQALDIVVDYFLKTVVEDAILGAYFKNIDMKKQHAIQKRFLSFALLDKHFSDTSLQQMRKAHKRMDLDNADFDQFLKLMRDAFGQLTLMTKETQDVIVERLEGYRSVIISE
ncbi:globin-like protein [Gorgonomyces haynaldii]|nr:globin-like protein [Gorgonomyces haynaldii]